MSILDMYSDEMLQGVRDMDAAYEDPDAASEALAVTLERLVDHDLSLSSPDESAEYVHQLQGLCSAALSKFQIVFIPREAADGKQPA
ncbi:MAG TPA: hypothetical protein VK165_10075 [Azonexus sp.]|nr:hypothetical protein [Azonexus sp.]